MTQCNISNSEHRTESDILIAYHCLRMLIALVAILSNGLTIYCVCRFQYLRTAANVMIVSLALGDLLNSILVAPLSIVIDHKCPDFSVWLRYCTVKQVFQLALNGVSFGSLLFIAIDRFICVIYPFRYEIIMTIKKAIVMLVTMWLLTIFATLMVIVAFGKQRTDDLDLDNKTPHCRYSDVIRTDVYIGAIIPTFLLYLVSTCALYLKIAWVARRHVTQIANQTASLDRDGSRRYKREAQMKITKMMAIVLGLYLVMYVPSLICNSLVKSTSTLPLKVLNYVLGLFWWTNSCVNPIIYAWRCPDFNHAFKTIIFCCDNDDDD